MIIDLIKLKNNIDEYIEIDVPVLYDSEYINNTELINLKNKFL